MDTLKLELSQAWKNSFCTFSSFLVRITWMSNKLMKETPEVCSKKRQPKEEREVPKMCARCPQDIPKISWGVAIWSPSPRIYEKDNDRYCGKESINLFCRSINSWSQPRLHYPAPVMVLPANLLFRIYTVLYCVKNKNKK